MMRADRGRSEDLIEATEKGDAGAHLEALRTDLRLTGGERREYIAEGRMETPSRHTGGGTSLEG